MKIIVYPFQTSWQSSFEKEKKQLQQLFGNLDIDFLHIGSTSIPQCDAKPIIDILGITADVTTIESYNGTLERAGWIARGEYGIPQRRYFQRKEPVRTNLHIFEDTDPEIERYLRFRNYLKKHPQARQEYSL